MHHTINHTEEQMTTAERIRNFCSRAKVVAKHLSHEAYIHGRRLAYAVHEMSAEHPSSGPISFLGVSLALAAALTVTTLYSSSYKVMVDGQYVGVVNEQEVVTDAMTAVERQGTRLLGKEFQLDDQVDYQFALTLASELNDQDDIETFFYERLDEVSTELRRYQISVSGKPIGAVQDEAVLKQLLEDLKQQFVTEDTVSVKFLEPYRIDHVYNDDNLMNEEEMKQALISNKTGDTTYSVVSGDTFNGIAYANDMSVSELKALNPTVNINRLMIGDVLNVKKIIPILSVQTVDDVTYSEAIPCPVEEREDPTIYKGSSKILVQGVEGESQVHATVTYVNGIEEEREILSKTTLREPTTTIKAIGTKERPKTASTGKYSWPIRGRITSYFGGRHIFGSYSYHSGIDISASYGAAIRAADGGTVTFSGNKGSYGKLVIITHDNGTKTYYAHNSSLLVSAGQKVYKGQQIAKAGSTGRSTGVHCHFEVRVNGTAVNPLSYLR